MWGHAIPLWRIIVHPLELQFSAISPSWIRLRGSCPTIFWSQFIYCRRWRAYLHVVYRLVECLKKQRAVTAIFFVLQYFWPSESYEIFSNRFLWLVYASKIGCYEVSDIEQKETCRIGNAHIRKSSITEFWNSQRRTFVKTVDHCSSLHSSILVSWTIWLSMRCSICLVVTISDMLRACSAMRREVSCVLSTNPRNFYA
jgi:hypothetical protein